MKMLLAVLYFNQCYMYRHGYDIREFYGSLLVFRVYFFDSFYSLSYAVYTNVDLELPVTSYSSNRY